MTNEEKALSIANLKKISETDTYENPFKVAIYERCLNMAEWKDEQFKNQEQTLLWTVEHILDRLCIEGEAREIAIREFTNDLQYYNEKENDSKE